MKIKAEEWILDYSDNVAYKIVSIEKCCDKLINSKNISLSYSYDENQIYPYGKNSNDYSVKLIRDEEDEYSDSERYFEEISYCPWCGEKIEIEIVNKVDKTDEYKLLKEKRHDLWGKYCITDSRKKETILRKQIGELDNKINDMLRNDDFNKEVNK